MTVVKFGVSFPKSLCQDLDQIRGVTPRSIFLQLYQEFINQNKGTFKLWLKKKTKSKECKPEKEIG